jgi:hypothetical protein
MLGWKRLQSDDVEVIAACDVDDYATAVLDGAIFMSPTVIATHSPDKNTDIEPSD